MPDDEPLDDARAVLIASAAAGAKIVETAARAAQELRQKQQQSPRGVTSGHTSTDGGSTAAYDSPERRQATDAALRTAGVGVEPREARVTADLMNGTDPAAAASSGKSTKARPARTAKVPEQTRAR